MSVGVITSTKPEQLPKTAADCLLPLSGNRLARARLGNELQNDISRDNIPLAILNGDVLHEIVSYIRGRDALNFSLTAHRVHDFAVHRVASRLVCRTSADLRRVHEHLLGGSPRRAVFLRSLSIMSTTFIDRPWQDDPNWTFPETTYQYSLASLVGDILEAAQGLTHLHLEHFTPLAGHDPRVGHAIASMSRLNSVELCQIDPSSLAVFQTMCSRPQHLRISTVKTNVPSEAKHMLDFVHDLLTIISYRKELRVLDLDLSAISCRPFKVPLEPREDVFPLPYVRRLSIHWFSRLVDVASLFPNLDILEQHINSYHLEKSSGAPLRRLSITELRAQGDSHQPVHMLHLPRYPRDLQSFLKTVGETSPVGLSMHCFVDTPKWLEYIEQLPAKTPRLKFIDIHCHTWERSPKAGWVARFIESLCGYSLVCLRVIAPQPPVPGSDSTRWLEEDVQALAELPDRLLQVMPSLRYVAWAPKRVTSEYQWYEDEYDCACAEYKWYRAVESGDTGRKLTAVSAGDGERVRRFLIEADLAAISDIDAHLTVGPIKEPDELNC
ncbi:hypothetical protein C8Q74DRAFT_1255482 [Fomes fomentarius]|nr:hypothetical protein C8Q74DRAFT_1255482 [Fomes fomentarius]